jgi:arylsulfatase A-like enzyme
LEESGEIENTYIVYTSDNGFHLGLHRMIEGKHSPYEEDIRVPLAMRGPSVPRGRRIGAMVLSIDLAPTFAAWAGAAAPDFVDGRSLAPLLRDPGVRWRHSFLVRRLGLESDEQLEDANMLAIRTGRYTYATYANGERELYDLERDPYQLQSIAATAPAGLIDALEARLEQLSTCRAETCRNVENLPIR